MRRPLEAVVPYKISTRRSCHVAPQIDETERFDLRGSLDGGTKDVQNSMIIAFMVEEDTSYSFALKVHSQEIESPLFLEGRVIEMVTRGLCPGSRLHVYRCSVQFYISTLDFCHFLKHI
jgi:hypothetical protein